MRRLAAAVVAGAVLGGAATAGAEPVRLGFTAVHALPQETWDGLSEEARVAFLEARGELAATLGAEVVRTGGLAPRLVSYTQVHASANRSFVFVDAVVGAFSRPDYELCLTLPDLLPAAEMATYRKFVEAIAERYDGDTEFGVPPAALNYEYPDINGSGRVSQPDWEATPEKKAAWAETHVAPVLEIGDEPRALEKTGQLDAGAYAAQLQSARAAVAAAQGGQRVMLAGTLLDDQSKKHFTDRLAPLPAQGVPWFDLANAHVLASAGDLTGDLAVANAAKLSDWLDAVGHPEAGRWLGEVAAGSAPADAAGGPCPDPRCSERTQAATLVRLVVRAVADGTGTVLYAAPVEVLGQPAGPRSGTGLLTVDLSSGLEPSLVAPVPRPAWAVWRRLQDALRGLDTGDVTVVPGLPQNGHGFRLGDRGWVLWSDWTREVSAGAPYGGGQKPIALAGLTAPSVRVVSLWPDEVGTALREDGTVDATWREELLPVEGGEVTVLVGEDPVWVERSDAVVAEPSEDAGPGEDTAAPDAGPAGDAGSGGGGGGGGCASAGAGPGPAGFALGLGLLLAAWRRRRTA